MLSFSLSRNELNISTITSCEGLKKEAYSGPFFFMHHANTVKVIPEVTTPYTCHPKAYTLIKFSEKKKKKFKVEERMMATSTTILTE